RRRARCSRSAPTPGPPRPAWSGCLTQDRASGSQPYRPDRRVSAQRPLVGRISPLGVAGTLGMVADVMTLDSHMRDGALEQRLFEVAPDALVVTTIDGRILRVNQAASDLVGLAPEDLATRSYWDLVHPADHEAVGTQHADLRRAGRNATPFRCRILHADGSWRWVESASAFDLDAGLIFSVVRDITGREDLELERLATLF